MKRFFLSEAKIELWKGVIERSSGEEWRREVGCEWIVANEVSY